METNKHRWHSWLFQLIGAELSPGKVLPEADTMVTGSVTSAVTPPPTHNRWRRPAVAVVVCLALALLWTGAAPLLAKAKLSNQTVALRSSDTTLAAAVTNQAQAYSLQLQYPDGTKQTYKLHDMGFSVDAGATVAAQKSAAHAWKQRLMWWQPVQVPLVLHTDMARLNTFIAQHVQVIAQPAKDATLSIVGGQVQVSDASAGKQYGLLRPGHALAAAASGLQPSPLALRALTVTPALTADQLASSKDLLDKTLHQHISFTIGAKTITPSPGDIAGWLDLTPDDKARKVDIDVNSGKVLAYINKIAATSIHPPRDQVVVSRADGSTSVLVSGQNGIDVVNKSDVASGVASKLLAGQGMQVPLPISTASFKEISATAAPKWIEVDLTNKRMYAYEQASLVLTFLVTAGAPATPTVTGTYAIYAKYSQQDMHGLNADGSHYFQPHVPWVNYFYKDYAIHGNYWRPLSYFGNINSSHGCVSVVDSEAAWIYNWAPIGTPVVVHT